MADAVAEPSVTSLVERLQEDGYAIVPGRIPAGRLPAIRESVSRIVGLSDLGSNSFLGFRTRRAYSLLAKTRVLDEVALDSLILGAANQILGHLQLGASVAIELEPGEVDQSLHTDQGLYPLPPSDPVIVNTMWAIDRFTSHNGATRLIPGSHRPGAGTGCGPSIEVAAEMEPGSVLVYLGNIRHRAGANTTTRPRLGVVIEYVAGWLRPQENLGLSYPPTVVKNLSPELQELLGYNLYPPFLGYVDGRHPLEWLSSQQARPPR